TSSFAGETSSPSPWDVACIGMRRVAATLTARAMTLDGIFIAGLFRRGVTPLHPTANARWIRASLVGGQRVGDRRRLRTGTGQRLEHELEIVADVGGRCRRERVGLVGQGGAGGVDRRIAGRTGRDADDRRSGGT